MEKVTAGQPFRPNQRDWNDFVDSAKRSKDNSFRQYADLDLPEDLQTKIDVRNETGVKQSRFAVLALTEPWKTPTDDLPQFQRELIFRGDVPGTYVGATDPWCVLLEPLQPGDVGEAVVFGLVPVEVTIVKSWHRYCDLTAGSTAALTSNNWSRAAAQIIWKESGTGTKWAIIAIGNPDAPGMYVARVPHGGIPRRVDRRLGRRQCEIWRSVPLVPGSTIRDLVPHILPGGARHIEWIYNLAPDTIGEGYYRVDQDAFTETWFIDCCASSVSHSDSDSSSSEPSSSSQPSSSQPSSSEPSSSEPSSSEPSSSEPSSSLSASSASALPTAPCGCWWVVMNHDLYPGPNCMTPPLTGRWLDYIGGGGSNCDISWGECVGGPYAPGTFDGEQAPC